jgi:hypothetical protein
MGFARAQPILRATDVVCANSIGPEGGLFAEGVAVFGALSAYGRVTRALSAAENLTPKFVPNPYGKLGGPAHRATVADTIAGIEARGLRAETEFRVLTPNGSRGSRFVDIVAYDRAGNIVAYYQVGKQTGAGLPIAREVDALNDLEAVLGIRPKFVPYNK